MYCNIWKVLPFIIVLYLYVKSVSCSSAVLLNTMYYISIWNVFPPFMKRKWECQPVFIYDRVYLIKIRNCYYALGQFSIRFNQKPWQRLRITNRLNFALLPASNPELPHKVAAPSQCISYRSKIRIVKLIWCQIDKIREFLINYTAASTEDCRESSRMTSQPWGKKFFSYFPGIRILYSKSQT